MWKRRQSACFPDNELPPTASIRISVDWKKKDSCLSFMTNLYLQKSLWQHQQDWTAKSFSRLITFPFGYCALCISAQWCRYHRLLFFSFQSVFLFVVVVFFLTHHILLFSPSCGCSEMAHYEQAECVCVWDISGWFSGTLAWRIARQKIPNNSWFATRSLRLSSVPCTHLLCSSNDSSCEPQNELLHLSNCSCGG